MQEAQTESSETELDTDILCYKQCQSLEEKMKLMGIDELGLSPHGAAVEIGGKLSRGPCLKSGLSVRLCAAFSSYTHLQEYTLAGSASPRP